MQAYCSLYVSSAQADIGTRLALVVVTITTLEMGGTDMNIKRILFATDFSECSNAALEVASRLTVESGARLYIVHVSGLLEISIPAIPPVEGGYYDAPWGYERREVRERLTKVVPTVANVAFEHCYLTGLPVAELLKCAESNDVDLIVMGSHGRSGFSRMIMGSVAEGVVRGASCPVLIVKPPAGALKDESAAVVAGAKD
jgi:universal stress protein A